MPRAGDGPEIILNGLCASQRFVQDLVHWLVNRQTTMLDDSHIMETESDEESDEEPTRIVSEPGFTVVSHSPAPHLSSVETPQPLHIDIQGLACAGFNGRSNKPADTCYSWWAGASLGVNNHLLISLSAEALVKQLANEFVLRSLDKIILLIGQPHANIS